MVDSEVTQEQQPQQVDSNEGQDSTAVPEQPAQDRIYLTDSTPKLDLSGMQGESSNLATQATEPAVINEAQPTLGQIVVDGRGTVQDVVANQDANQQTPDLDSTGQILADQFLNQEVSPNSEIDNSPEARAQRMMSAVDVVAAANERARLFSEYHANGNDITDPAVVARIEQEVENFKNREAVNLDETSAQEYLNDVLDEEDQEKFWEVVGGAFGNFMVDGIKSSSMTDFIDALFGYADFKSRLGALGWSGTAGEKTKGREDLSVNDLRKNLLRIDDSTPEAEAVGRFSFIFSKMGEFSGVKLGINLDSENENYDELVSAMADFSKKIEDGTFGPDILTAAMEFAFEQRSSKFTFGAFDKNKRFFNQVANLFREIGRGNQEKFFNRSKSSPASNQEQTQANVIPFPNQQPTSQTEQPLKQAA